MNTEIHCSVCGFRFQGPGITEDLWLGQVRYVVPDEYFDSPGSRVFSEKPFLSTKSRMHFRGHGPAPGVAVLFNPSQEEYVEHDSIMVFPSPAFSSTIGFPMHESCWNILDAMLEDKDVSFRTRMSILYSILNNTPFTINKLLWPHQYYGQHTYHHPAWLPPIDPAIGKSDPWTVEDPNSVDSLRAYSDKVREAPHIFPLPVELVERIYHYLDWREIEKLREIEFDNDATVELPGSYWKHFLELKSEFGWFSLNQLVDQFPKYSWYQKFCLAERSIRGSDPKFNQMKNRLRIWKICKALSDVVLDICKGETVGLNDGASDDLTSQPSQLPTLTAQSETIPTRAYANYPFVGSESLYQGKVDWTTVDAMLLSYSGTERLSYLSGITLLPGGERIGYITNQTRLVSWESSSVLSVAISMHGVVDISLSDDMDKPNWAFEDAAFQERKLAVRRKLLAKSYCPTREVMIKAKFDASKMTEIHISSPDILSETQVKETNEEETWTQSNSWIPSIPSSQMRINAASYSGLLLPTRGVFRPLRHITFPEKPLIMVSGWTSSRSLTALTFHFEELEENPPSTLTLGIPVGVPIEFPINGKGGEEISSVRAFLEPESQHLYGIMFETTAKRKCIFAVKSLGKCEIRLMVPQEGSKIRGFYGTAQAARLTAYLTTIGLITSHGLDCSTISTPFAPHADFFDNAICGSREENISSEVGGIGMSNILLSDYSEYWRSKACLSSCRRIYVYAQETPDTDDRIVGLRLEYDPGVIKGDNPVILGQISDAKMEPLVLYLDGKTTITSINVLVERHLDRQRQGWRCIGLRMQMSDKNIFQWGSNSEPAWGNLTLLLFQSTLSNLQPNSTLEWDFNEKFDRIKAIDPPKESRGIISSAKSSTKSEDEPRGLLKFLKRRKK